VADVPWLADARAGIAEGTAGGVKGFTEADSGFADCVLRL